MYSIFLDTHAVAACLKFIWYTLCQEVCIANS